LLLTQANALAIANQVTSQGDARVFQRRHATSLIGAWKLWQFIIGWSFARFAQQALVLALFQENESLALDFNALQSDHHSILVICKLRDRVVLERDCRHDIIMTWNKDDGNGSHAVKDAARMVATT
jgi:hypothetical protein